MNSFSLRLPTIPDAVIVLALGLMLCGFCRAQQEQPFEVQDGDLFVAPDGDDHWSGTLPEPSGSQQDGPFATLARALQAIRDRHAERRLCPRILIRAGTYALDQPLELGPDDSGSAQRPLIIAAYPGEQPVLDGGARLSGTWQKSPDGPVWTLQLSDLPARIDDLFLNGKRLPCARLPQEGFWKAQAVSDAGSRTQFQFEPGQLHAWPDAASARILIKSYEWFDETLPIQSIDEESQTVTLAKTANHPLVSKDEPGSGDYYIENVRAALGQPGEWCFDTKRRLVSFWPPAGVDPNRAEIVTGARSLLISLQGNEADSQWVEHIILEGLTFVHTARSEKGETDDGIAVRFASGVRDCEVRHCLFADLGGCGVVLAAACTGNSISGNEFVRTGNTPIKIFNYVDEATPLSSDNTIENNSIHDCGTVVLHLEGIAVEDSGKNRIDHNLIYNMPYVGISFNGARPDNWNPAASPGISAPYTAAAIKPFIPTLGNIVEFNHVHHVMQQLRDGGGIYFWGVMGSGAANIIRNNLVEHVEGSGTCVGLYLDDDCDDVQVTDNIVNDANYGIHLHGASRDLLENNIIAYSHTTDLSVQPEKYNVGPMDTILRHNIFFDCAGSILFDTSWAPWDRKPLGKCDDNLYWQGGKTISLGAGTYAGMDRHSRVADPEFQNPAQGDFRLKNDSPALGLGIHSINLQGVGLSTGVGPAAGSVPQTP